MNNVIKHSGASRADDGTGISGDNKPQPGSQGIAGMRERMHDLGGDCEVVARSEGGTMVNLMLPLRPL